MFELRVLTGRRAGTVCTPAGSTCRVGRAPTADLRLDDPGVWDEHLVIETRARQGVFARLLPPALATLNGAPFGEALLRHGDQLDLGSVRLRFWLRAPMQRSLVPAETLLWISLGLLCLLQAGLILWLGV